MEAGTSTSITSSLPTEDVRTHPICRFSAVADDSSGDPWLEATVSAQSSPYRANDTRPVGVSDGFHVSDLVTFNAFVDSTVAAVQNQGLAAIGTWLGEFRPVSENVNEVKGHYEG